MNPERAGAVAEEFAAPDMRKSGAFEAHDQVSFAMRQQTLRYIILRRGVQLFKLLPWHGAGRPASEALVAAPGTCAEMSATMRPARIISCQRGHAAAAYLMLHARYLHSTSQDILHGATQWY